MKKGTYLMIAASVILIAGISYGYLFPSSDADANQQMMASRGGMMQMMNEIPRDVTVVVKSPQVVSHGQSSEVVLQVLDKTSSTPATNAKVIVGIEKGASMTTMHMETGMSYADSMGNGDYVVRFTPSEKGVYTLHVHVIPEGKTMHSMMQNHLDIGIISK